MSAIRGPRVAKTRGATLDSPGERAATQRSVGDLNPKTKSIVPNPERSRRFLPRPRVPSSQPATHSFLCQCRRPSPRFRGEV